MATTPSPPPPPQQPSFTTTAPIPPSTPQLYHSFTPSNSTTANVTNHRTKKRSKYLGTNLLPDHTLTLSTSSEHNMPPPCTECGKVFWSMKALFGHMRCHPERRWRGINPPPNLRRPSNTSHATSSSNDDDHEAAQGLLMLATTSSAVRFECSCCKKTFGSPQALGGHRASHKNVKGCFANAKNALDLEGSHMEGQNRNNEMLDLNLGLGLGHQALGGRMRCHWSHQVVSSSSPKKEQCGLDLNVPAPVYDNGTCSLSTMNIANNSSNSRSRSNLRLDLRLGI